MILAQTAAINVPQRPSSPAAGPVSGVIVRTLRTYQVSQTSADPAMADRGLYEGRSKSS